MQAATVTGHIPPVTAAVPGVRDRLRDDVAYQALMLLRIGL
jgi:hypothetical protein